MSNAPQAAEVDPEYHNPYSEASLRAEAKAALESERLRQAEVDRVLRKARRGPKLSRLEF